MNREAVLVNRDEAVQQAKKLVAQGWEVLACDVPETGMRGFYAFRYIHKETHEVLAPPFKPEDAHEETKMLEWPIFDKPMTEVDDKMVETDDLVNFIGDDRENLALCDDPKKLMLGFVRYEPDKSKSVVRRVRLAQVKNSDSRIRKVFMSLREELYRQAGEDHKSLIREIHNS
jgi:hypothetical protein